MVHHYTERFQWIFKYTSKNVGYCILKTLCIIVGFPIYLVCFIGEMALTLINLILSIVPIVNLLVTLLCKVLMWLLDKPFYICILTDLKRFNITTHDIPDYADVTHLSANGQSIADADIQTDVVTIDPSAQPTDEAADPTAGQPVETIDQVAATTTDQSADIQD